MKRRYAVLALVALAIAGVAGAQYTTKVYIEQGAAKLVVTSGGEIEVRSGGVLDIQSGATGAFPRSVLTEDALQPYGIPIITLQQTTGIPLSASETAGNFNVAIATHVNKAQGEITDNETEVSVVHFQFVLPPEYVSGGDISVSVPCAVIKTAAATDNGSTVDVAVYLQAAGAVGSDLSTTTSAATFAAMDTWYTKTFVITPTGLVAGSFLDVEITSSIIDNEAGGGTLRFNMDPPKVLLDVKG
jgi:hypothetical protein